MTDRKKKYLAAAFFAAFILLSAAVFWYAGKPLIAFASEPERFRQWIDSRGIWGRLAFLGMTVLQVFVAVIPGEPLEIAAGYCFGALEGTLLCMLGMTVGGVLIFWFTRTYGIKAVEDDRILLYGGRGYHGPSLLMRGQEQVLSGAYADSLYNDPIPDVMEGGEVLADAFGEVPLYPDRASIDPDLNPELVMHGVYALPYLGDGQFGKIEHVETVQTLGSMLDELYGE